MRQSDREARGMSERYIPCRDSRNDVWRRDRENGRGLHIIEDSILRQTSLLLAAITMIIILHLCISYFRYILLMMCHHGCRTHHSYLGPFVHHHYQQHNYLFYFDFRQLIATRNAVRKGSQGGLK